MKDEKSKAIEFAISQLEKEFGKGAIMKLGDGAHAPVEAIPTGALSLDIAIGIGGVPRGRVVEIFGPESSGKTTLSLHIAAEAQKTGGYVAFIDAEHAMDPEYAKRLGVDIENLYVSQPDSGEQALEICEKMVRTGAMDVVIIDSVAALTPKAEIDGEMGAAHMGLQARLMSQALRKLTSSISKSKTCVIFINQLREKIGVMFGNPETTTGGRALKFYSSVRLDIRRISGALGEIKEGESRIGFRTRVKVVKNKVAAPFRQAEFDMTFGSGISKEGCILDCGVEQNVVEKTGNWFIYKGERLGNGRDNAISTLKGNKELAQKIEKEVRQAAFSPAKPSTQTAAKPSASSDGNGKSPVAVAVKKEK